MDKKSNSFDSVLAEYYLDHKEAYIRAKNEVAFFCKNMKIKKGDNLLDIPCGLGRHSILFLEKQISAVGLDISSDCISYVKKKYPIYSKKFCVSNMLNLKKYHNEFDHIISIGGSIGYFLTKKDQLKSVKELKRSLKKDGLICISMANRIYAEKNIKTNYWDETDKAFWLSDVSYDAKTGIKRHKTVHINKKTNKKTIYSSSVKFFYPEEISNLLKQCGFGDIKFFDVNMQEQTPSGRYYYVLARKFF